MPAPVIDAVTALLVCEGELFVVRRQPHLSAFPGYHAFPGGKVEADDADSAIAHPLLAAHDPRHMHALVRELREEVSFDLMGTLEAGEVLAFSGLGQVLTPPIAAQRFNTAFYRIDLRCKPAFKLDPAEAAEGSWAPPGDWLRRFANGDLLLAPPTLATLRALAQTAEPPRTVNLFATSGGALIPVLEPLAGLRVLVVRSNTLPPATHTNCFHLGDPGSPRLLVDPAPASDDELARLQQVASTLGVDRILLTHHHIDHRERAERLAMGLGVPLAMSGDTAERILRCSPRLFDGLCWQTVEDGDRLTEWHGQPVRALAVPGHDEGQLALMPENGAWCIVGDLIQGIGTVVIAKPEGHMGRYFASLQRIIDLDPKVIFPSHGMGMGTTYRLTETLSHRRAREQEVLERWHRGETPQQMLAGIYPNLDPVLLPLAHMTIDTHLEKLREEGQIAA